MSKAKEILHAEDARQKVLKGVETLAKAVKVTMGATGKIVAIEEGGETKITKDGVTVAKSIFLEDKFENMGAQMVKQASTKAAELAGDGTTTATVLAEAIYKEGMKAIASGANAVEVKRGIDTATKETVKGIIDIAKPIENAEQIANIGKVSANNDEEIGNIIAEAMAKVGKDGVINIEESSTAQTNLQVTEGMQFSQGFIDPHFKDKDSKKCEMSNPLILVCEDRISNLVNLMPILEIAVKEARPLMIIAEDVDGDALTGCVINKMRGQIEVCAVKAPGFGDRKIAMLEDIAVLTGSTYISQKENVDWSTLTIEHLGSAEKITVDKSSTVIQDGQGKNIKQRIEVIKEEIKEAISDYDREKNQERLAKLTGGVAIIQVGAATELELKEKKDRLEDALYATRAAVEEGIVVGGGVTLAKQSKELVQGLNSSQRLGYQALQKALTAPLKQIAENSGKNGEVVLNNVLASPDMSIGYNALTEEYEDLFVSGIIDPVKVTRTALETAASIAGSLLTVETLVAETESPDQFDGGMSDMGMGGMPGMM